MREILFRGKTEKGDWYIGSLCKSTFEKPITTNVVYKIQEFNQGFADEDEFEPTYISGFDEEVIPETVGQYTGVDDRNGKKIFENDIVLVYARGYHTVCTVAWAETVAHFQLWQVNTVPGTPTALNLGNYDCEVIGNIIDNPELLEV